MNERTLFLGGEQGTAEARLFDLIVADISMPDISGHLLVKKFLEIRPDISPIVLLTGEDGHAQSEARHTGVEWFGIKPLSMPDLAGTIRRALTNRTAERP